MEKNAKMVKFEEIAQKRVNEAIKKIQIIGNLANKSNYSYTDEHVKQIFRAIETELKTVKMRFQRQG